MDPGGAPPPRPLGLERGDRWDPQAGEGEEPTDFDIPCVRCVT
jgi:hypothetical protein